MKTRYNTNKEELKMMLKDLGLKNVNVRSTQLHGGGYWLRKKNSQGLAVWVRKSDVGTKRLLKQHLRNVFDK